MNYQYNFDGYINGSACGWIFNSDAPTKRVELGLFVDGALHSIALADLSRPDLVDAKISDGNCAFNIPVPSELKWDRLEVKILIEEITLKGSVKALISNDVFTSSLLNSHQFHNYQQFKVKKERRQVSRVSPPAISSRLVSEYSKTCKIGTSEIPQHMHWILSRDRKGSSNFFDTANHGQLDNLYWYFFDYRCPSKLQLNQEALEKFFEPIYEDPDLSHFSLIYSVWLHKNGRRLSNFHQESKDEYFSFVCALIDANTPIYQELMPSWLTKNLPKQYHIKGSRLPKISKFAEIKFYRSYDQHYSLTNPQDYLAYLFDIYIHASMTEMQLMGEEVLKFFKEPITLSNGEVSRLSYMLWKHQLKSTDENLYLTLADDASLINRWFTEIWVALFPNHAEFALNPYSESRVTNKSEVSSNSVYIVAFWDNEHGLTKNALMSYKAMQALGLRIVKLYPDGRVFSIIESPDDAARGLDLAKNVVLLHVNADKVPEVLPKITNQVHLDSAHIIGFYLWELEQVPACHLLGLSLIDELWAPTSFVYDIYSSLVRGKARLVGKAIEVPHFDAPDRSKFNMPVEKISILITYDFNSGIERKNPLAAVKAFQLAFGNRSDVQLIIKATPYHRNHWGDPFNQWEHINSIAENDSRIEVIEEFLSNDELFELVAAADIIVSSHRAEGFGYLPAYGIFYNKRVIATNYSGVTDFGPISTIRLVDHSLVQLPNGKFIYPVPGAVWADISIAALAKELVEAAAVAKELPTYKELRTNKKFTDYYSFERLSSTYRDALNGIGKDTQGNSLAA